MSFGNRIYFLFFFFDLAYSQLHSCHIFSIHRIKSQHFLKGLPVVHIPPRGDNLLISFFHAVIICQFQNEMCILKLCPFSSANNDTQHVFLVKTFTKGILKDRHTLLKSY